MTVRLVGLGPKGGKEPWWLATDPFGRPKVIHGWPDSWLQHERYTV